MDELPELLVEAVGDGTVVETVALGGGDAVAVAGSETHLYRSDGLLSDESVESFAHDVERLAVDGGRRKSKIRLAIVDDERDFTVPSKVADDVVVAMLEGVLRTTGVVADGEAIRSTFRFSELTLVVTDAQLLKHVGGAVWDDEYEAFRYADLTRLEFEAGSVATQVVLQADGRQQRVKVPNDHAGRVREDIQSAVFEFHGVSSLGGLHAAIEPDPADGSGDADGAGADAQEADAEDADAKDAEVEEEDSEDGGDTDDYADFALEPDAAGTGDAEPDAVEGDASATAGESGEDNDVAAGDAAGDGADDRDDGFVSADWSPPADQDITGPKGAVPDEEDGAAAGGGTATRRASGGSTRDQARSGGEAADVEALAARVETLAERVDRQNDLLESQGATIERLVEELRTGR